MLPPFIVRSGDAHGPKIFMQIYIYIYINIYIGFLLLFPFLLSLLLLILARATEQQHEAAFVTRN